MYFSLISYRCNHVDYAMILAEFANISQTNPLHATGMLRYCSVSLKKLVELQMCFNLGGLLLRQCGRIWKIKQPVWWKMQTPPHVTYLQYLDHFAKCSNTWSTTFTNHISFLITLFYFRFTRFSGFLHVKIGKLTFATPCIYLVYLSQSGLSRQDLDCLSSSLHCLPQ